MEPGEEITVQQLAHPVRENQGTVLGKHIVLDACL
jgi:hypothetical protein